MGVCNHHMFNYDSQLLPGHCSPMIVLGGFMGWRIVQPCLFQQHIGFTCSGCLEIVILTSF